MHGVLWPVTGGEICKHIRRIFLNQSAQRTKDGKKRNQITPHCVGQLQQDGSLLVGAEMESVMSYDQEIQVQTNMNNGSLIAKLDLKAVCSSLLPPKMIF